MYRFSILLPLFLLVFSTSACGPQRHFAQLTSGQSIDQRLVGSWGGSETDDQLEGMKKSWVMERTESGTFSLDFQVTYRGQAPQQIIETGRWWIKDGLFYEYHNVSGQTDVYAYDVLNKQQIRFRSHTLSSGGAHDDDAYTFVDTRVVK